MKCSKCGSDNRKSRKSCAKCGAALGAVGKPATRTEGMESLEETKPPSSRLDLTEKGPGPPSESIAEPGEIIGGKYEIIAELGRGGMGLVCRAKDRQLGRQVALKRLQPGEESGTWDIERFRQEAKAIAALNHQNIVVIHELGEDGKGPFIVMELVEGRDLGSKIDEEGPIPLEEAIPLMKSICRAIAYAHRKGVVHRDIKPSNVLLAPDGTPKLVDFGLARLGSKSDLSQTGMSMGTLAYVAPEQLIDSKSADHRSDIYSLGKTFYEMLTAESPQTVDYEEVPEELRDMLRNCLKSKPEERYFSVDDILSDISDIETVSSDPPSEDAEGVELGVCSECGRPNDLDARFCAFCSTDLFSNCPNCGEEVRTGLRFCKYCRADIPTLVRIGEHLDAADEYMEVKQYSRVVRECRGILALDENHGEAQQLLGVAEEALRKLDGLKKEIETAVYQLNIERAQELYQEAETLTDTSVWLKQQDQGLVGRMARLGLYDARKKFEEGRYEDALWSVRHAQSLGSKEAEELLQAIEEKKGKYTEKLAGASRAYARGDYEEVARILAKYRDKPGLEAAHGLITRAKDAAVALEKAFKEARLSLQTGEFARGIKACEGALQTQGDNEELKAVKKELERQKRDVEDLLKDANKYLSGQQYEKAIAGFREVVGKISKKSVPERAEAEKGIQTSEEALSAIQQALAEARRKSAQGDFAGSIEECDKVIRLQRNNEEAKALRKELERGKMYDTAEKMAREAFRTGKYGRAIQLWEAVVEANPQSGDAGKYLEASKKAARLQKARLIIAVAIGVFVAGAVYAFYRYMAG